VIGFSLVLAAIVALPPADATDRVSRVVPLADGAPIHVDATVADVTIVGSNRPDVLVEIVRRAPTAADLSSYPVVIGQRDGALHITVLQTPINGEPGRDANLKTEIAITAPATAKFESVRVFEGRVRVTSERHAVMAELGAGEVLGALSLAGGPRRASIETLSRCRLLRLGRDGFHRLAANDPPVAARLLENIAREAARRADAALAARMRADSEG